MKVCMCYVCELVKPAQLKYSVGHVISIMGFAFVVRDFLSHAAYVLLINNIFKLCGVLVKIRIDLRFSFFLVDHVLQCPLRVSN